LSNPLPKPNLVKKLNCQTDLDASSSISSKLQSLASSTDATRRNSNMIELCKLGMQIGDQIDSHAADWKCGTFNHDEVVFPSLLRDGVEVRPREVVGAGA
jgi:hypothetical protein